MSRTVISCRPDEPGTFNTAGVHPGILGSMSSTSMNPKAAHSNASLRHLAGHAASAAFALLLAACATPGPTRPATTPISAATVDRKSVV